MAVFVFLPKLGSTLCHTFFFFKGYGAPRDLPSSPTRRSSDPAFFLGGPVVRIVRVRLPAQYARGGIDEATQIAHMAVGIAPRASLAEPQDVRHAKLVAQD